jgi:hypothetical protein
MSKEIVIRQLTRECDNLATRFWQLEASGRGRGYLEWLQKVRQTADIIEKNRLQSCYFSSNRLKSANTNGFKRSGVSKSNKSNRKVTA